MTAEIERIAKAKSAYRKIRAALPFPEKIRILVRMQERHAPILRARGLNPRVWRIEESKVPSTKN